MHAFAMRKCRDCDAPAAKGTREGNPANKPSDDFLYFCQKHYDEFMQSCAPKLSASAWITPRNEGEPE